MKPKRTILCVDDDERSLSIRKLMLETRGYRVITCFNGLVARERLVTRDDEQCRLVYAVVEGRPSHYNAAVQVLPEGEGRSRVVWTTGSPPL